LWKQKRYWGHIANTHRFIDVGSNSERLGCVLSTWMVVEDEPDIYEVLLAMFGIWGIDGVAFVDGEEAVAWIDDVDNGRFQGELPELALLDIRLPGEVNGAAVGERLRESQVLGQVAIVLTTAYKLNPDEERAVVQQAGADRLVYKPLPKFGELQTLLEDTIAKRRATQSASAPSSPSSPAESK
jgi:CheY-like chemotaxis protein